MACPITCHALNTVSGTPANDLKATLKLLAPSESPISFSSITNKDGRVTEWSPSEGKTLQDVMETFSQGEKIPWSVTFEIGPWYEAKGIESFWPEVEIKFYVKKGERHYHVPVLIGPWSYTTYRGS